MPSDKPEAVKGAVIAKYVQGQNKTKIAEDLGTTRGTIRRILNEAEIDQYFQQTRSIYLESSPEIAESIVAEAKKNVHIGLEIMDRTGILPKREAGNASSSFAVAVNFNDMPGLK